LIHGLFRIVHRCQGLDVGVKVAVVGGVAKSFAAL
jgi:hypothetical protein